MPDLRLALQKSGRLSEDSLSLIKRCGIRFDSPERRLIVPCESFPLDLLMVRDDDIPSYVDSGVADLGIVGLNIVREFESKSPSSTVKVFRRLGFGRCRLAIAIPENSSWENIQSLSGLRIASSYPASLARFLSENNITATIVPMTGSVEIAPGMGLADAICDLVSSGSTLRSNGLLEVLTIYESEAVLISRENAGPDRKDDLERLSNRIDGVLNAHQSRYIMMNAHKNSVDAIARIVPGLGQPTVMPLAGAPDRVAIHVVVSEDVFWETLENLKAQGASDILVLPIEKMMA